MNYSPIIKKVRFIFKVKGMFDLPFSKQVDFFSSLPVPKDAIERSFNQYRCLKFFEGTITVLLFDFVGFLLGNLYLLFNLFLFKPAKNEIVDAIGDAIGENGKNIIPSQLKEEYPIYFETEFDNRPYLSFKDYWYIFKIIKRHPLSCWFTFKLIFKISKYSAYICRNSPKAFIVHNEYSFTSSVLTDFCHQYGIEHINYQHGERLWQIQCGFSEYDRFYVWDEYYADILTSLNVKTHFINYTPQTLLLDENICQNDDYYFDLKYYLGFYSEEEFKLIVDCLRKVEKKGLSWCVRLHPRYSNQEIAIKYLDNIHIESNMVSIEHSITNCKYACSIYSTVLYQAYSIGKQIVIDDISISGRYDILANFKYIMIGKKHMKLSDFINI